MTLPRFFSGIAMFVVAAIMLGFGSAYLEVQRRNQMAAEIDQWRLEEWTQNLLAERNREFLERCNK